MAREIVLQGTNRKGKVHPPMGPDVQGLLRKPGISVSSGEDDSAKTRAPLVGLNPVTLPDREQNLQQNGYDNKRQVGIWPPTLPKLDGSIYGSVTDNNDRQGDKD